MSGTRDAVHVPVVAARAKYIPLSTGIRPEYVPGAYVKFVDDKFMEFIICDKKEAHGILNPFLDEISVFDTVLVFIMPGITTPVRHDFKIDPKFKEIEQGMLQSELEYAKKSDPECAGCYEIRNNTVIRN